MPFHTNPTPTHSPEEFCLALKAAREEKGVTLAEIANATKVPVSVFVALERGDLRRWPKGLFRRSFFRGYVKMIGVPVAETFAEFIRLFPDEEVVEPAPNAETPLQQTSQNDGTPLSGLIAALTDAVSNVFANARSPQEADEPEMRGWVTDARRVAPSPRLRVRIKVPK